MLKLNRVLFVAFTLATAAPMLMTVEGCSSTAAAKKKKKGAGAKGGTAAKTAGQKVGSTAANKKDTATKKGAELDGVKCDAAEEGVSWCSTDAEITFCSGGEWYAIDCGGAVGGVCADDLDTKTIDCYAPADAE
jgi:hypothetical protein